MAGSRRRKHHEEEEHENHERWLVTFADMLTVLMALFIVLFAISNVDKTKAEQVASSARDYFGNGPELVDGGAGLLEDQKPGDDVEKTLVVNMDAAVKALEEKQAREKAVATENSELAEVQKKITQSLKDKNLQDSVRFRIDERGLVVTVVTDEVLFDLGSADLRPAGRTVLDGIGPALVPLPNPVTVEGHTDDLPIVGGGRYATNWELSTERATTVLRYMIDAHRLPPQRMAAAGYADTRPIAENVPATRGVNRRVVVIVKATAQEAPPSAAPARPAGAPAAPPAAPAAPAPATAAGPIQEQD